MPARIQKLLAAPTHEGDEKARIALLIDAALLALLVATAGAAIMIVAEPVELAFTLTFGIILIAVVLVLRSFVARSITHELGRVRHNALAERTCELETSRRITSVASEGANPGERLRLMIDAIRDQFHLYHVQAYIVDKEQGAAVLRASTGSVGRQLLQEKHHIPLDRPALITKAIREGEPVLVADVGQDPSFVPNPLLPETQSELMVPMRIGRRVVGVLDFQDRAPARFAESTVSLFQTIADQVALFFENGALLERASEQAEALILLKNQLCAAADIAGQLSACDDPDLLLRQVVALMQSRFDLCHADAYVLDQEQRQLTLSACSDAGGKAPCECDRNISLDAGQSLVAHAARTQEIVVVNDTGLDSSFVPSASLFQMCSEVAVPLVVDDRVLAVLHLRDSQPGRFTCASLDTFGTLSSQVATALQHARLAKEQRMGVEERRRFTNQLRAAADLGKQITATHDTDHLLHEIVTQLYQRLNLRHVQAYLMDTTTGELVIHAGCGETDRALRKQGQRLPLDHRQSLVARAARERIIVPSLTPETYTEAAVPLMIDDEVLGMLYVQDSLLTQSDLDFFSALASHIATALQNAALCEEIQHTGERLREVDRLKNEFLDTISHELCTPLNAILGYTEILLLGIDHELEPATREDVQAIYDHSQRLLRIIHDVLDLTKIKAGQVALNTERVAIEQLLDEIKNRYAEQLVNKPIEMAVEVEKGLPFVEADYLRLSQILNHVLSNAVKFTEKGSITLRAFNDDGWVCVEIQDTGVGITAAELEEVTRRLCQVDGSSLRRSEDAAGRGLEITGHLVHMHGGTIEVRSQPGQGSTFTLRLPVQRPNTESMAAQEIVR